MYVLTRKLDQGFVVSSDRGEVRVRVSHIGKSRIKLVFETVPKGSLYISRAESEYRGEIDKFTVE